MATSVTDYEGDYVSADGVSFEARHMAELQMFVLSRNDNPTDIQTVDESVFIETVEDGTITRENDND